MKYILASLAAVATASSDHYRFMSYMAEHQKSYNSVEEFASRFGIWQINDAFIQKHNASGLETHTVGHNFLSDMTATEKSNLLSLKYQPLPEKKVSSFTAKPNSDYKNWVDNGCVTPIKDQGQCGSCWSFSATGALESAYCIAGNALTSLSEQQLVSCSYTEGNNGCNGGWYFWAWEYLKTYESMTEASYPYTAQSDYSSCTYDPQHGVTYVSSYAAVESDDSDALKAAIETQPVSVAIEADTATYQFYTGGVITSSGCGTYIDHAVLAVGYGTWTDGNEYFLVKNSWGTSWGDEGYVKIGVSSGDGICGIQEYPYTVSV